MEILVPVGIFVVGIIVSIAGGSLGIARLQEVQKTATGKLGATAAYDQPFPRH
jgi:hypothetical protein